MGPVGSLISIEVWSFPKLSAATRAIGRGDRIGKCYAALAECRVIEWCRQVHVAARSLDIKSFSIIVPMPTSLWAEAWKKLRPYALSFVIEFGLYLRVWAMVLGAHIVRVVMAAAGIDPELVSLVGWMEKWVFFASFVSFFWRVVVNLYKEARRHTP
jgi:hypothetical protein